MKKVKLSVLKGVLHVDDLPQGVQVIIDEHDDEESYVVKWKKGEVVEESRIYGESDPVEELSDDEIERRNRLFETYTAKYGLSEEEANEMIQIWFDSAKEAEEEWEEG